MNIIRPVDLYNFPFIDAWTDGCEVDLVHLLNRNIFLGEQALKLWTELLRLAEGGELIVHDVDYIISLIE